MTLTLRSDGGGVSGRGPAGRRLHQRLGLNPPSWPSRISRVTVRWLFRRPVTMEIPYSRRIWWQATLDCRTDFTFGADEDQPLCLMLFDSDGDGHWSS